MRATTNSIFLFIVIATIGRLIPHPPDVTPLSALCVLITQRFSMRISFTVVLLSLFFSDILLSLWQNHTILGSWSWFTYSGFMGVVVFDFLRQKNKAAGSLSLVFSTTFFSVLLFWLWTNFGSWIATSLYAKNSSGLMQCYIAALPFLRNSLCGSMVWVFVLSWLLKMIPSSEVKYKLC